MKSSRKGDIDGKHRKSDNLKRMIDLHETRNFIATSIHPSERNPSRQILVQRGTKGRQSLRCQLKKRDMKGKDRRKANSKCSWLMFVKRKISLGWKTKPCIAHRWHFLSARRFVFQCFQRDEDIRCVQCEVLFQMIDSRDFRVRSRSSPLSICLITLRIVLSNGEIGVEDFPSG